MDHLPAKDVMCHRTDFEKSCRQLVCDGACKRWKMVLGESRTTGAPTEQWDCIDNHAHTLLLNIIAAAQGGQAATESFRNEVIGRAPRKANDTPPAQIEYKDAAE